MVKSILTFAVALPLLAVSQTSSADTLSACTSVTDDLERQGVIRSGGITRERVTIYVSGNWYRLDFEEKSAVATCLNMRIAGGEGKTLSVPIVFLDGTSGREQARFERGRLAATD